ncbi:DUF2023 family protein [Puteibacter caeruleilacunae]|nr:DUF2023 family protein [Puteibacter caeruleilacunae]
MSCTCQDYRSADLQILMHHIYEYKKGIRNLVLHTMCHRDKDKAEHLLSQRGLDYSIRTVNEGKINIFFGNPDCIRVVRSFGDKSLSDYTPEEDFILGVMLGYDRNQQCLRYLDKKEGEKKNELLSRA